MIKLNVLSKDGKNHLSTQKSLIPFCRVKGCVLKKRTILYSLGSFVVNKLRWTGTEMEEDLRYCSKCINKSHELFPKD